MDNTTSSKDILQIACALRYSIKIKKNASEALETFNFDLKLYSFNGIQRNRKGETFEFQFDLKQVFEDFLEAKTDNASRSKIIQ